MARYDGKRLRGIIGPYIFRDGNSKKHTIVQSKAEKVTQTEASQKTAGVFGNASVLSRNIRDDLRCLTGKFYDGTMINRLNTVNRSIMEHCFDKQTEIYTYQSDSFNNLVGFEFNDYAKLSAHIWVEQVISLEGNNLTLSLPTFAVPTELTMPVRANEAEITVTLGQYVLADRVKKQREEQKLTVVNGEQVPAHDFTFEVAEGCLCVLSINVEYFQTHQSIKKPLNTKTLNPAAVFGAVITPGTFVLPPLEKTEFKSKASPWSRMDK
ncbi:hypothetical protein [Pedobacter frigoris]|uniref:Uncharacterized protein n=1 Tax=Pedobacter frigoris TaxID=2571272 RepID=A0A4U1CCT7_9SPHI|nr:hypothetical protein [Pedobacter frigoris]TKC03990.1 hypothetical protein FA047_18785 [Pedobacter frigoris]